MNLVFGTAFRATSERCAAEEITQNVFIALARKALWLQREGSLAAWLHRATLMEARQWWRSESRRRAREQAAAELETTMKTTPHAEHGMVALLDEALLELREPDRQAVLLRHFEARTHREIGTILGIGEDAARKRVDKAMSQLAAFFRKRGFAGGSATTIAAAMAGASEPPSVNLAGAAAAAGLASAGRQAPGWLVKLAGVSRAKLASLCLLVLLAPPAWQQTRLLSLRAEHRRMEASLELLGSQRTAVREEIAQVQRLTEDALAQSDMARSRMAADSASETSGVDRRWFLWDEKSDYVRVPKAVLGRINFGGIEDRWGLDTGTRGTMDKEGDRVSPTVLGVLGLTADEQSRVQDAFRRHLEAYRKWVESNSYLADFSHSPAASLVLPNGLPATNILKLSQDTRVWVVPSVPTSVEWREQFRQELSLIMGDERTDILLGMARDDGSLDAVIKKFGAQETLVVATPNPDGGFWLSQNSSGTWLFNTPASFSEALHPTPWDPFDEAAARQEILGLIEQRRAQFPGEEIPPFENILEQHRRDWRLQQSVAHPSVIQQVLGRALPEPLALYLQQWHTDHPHVKDSPGAQSK